MQEIGPVIQNSGEANYAIKYCRKYTEMEC